MQLLANTTSPFVRIARIAMIEKGLEVEPTIVDPWADDARLREANAATRVPRSEERRVGKECGLLCRSRWSPYH